VRQTASSGASRVLYVALAANLAIAAAKVGAYALSGSSGLLTEAVHSLVDSIDQILLLVGQKRGRRPPDAAHPFGHGMEAYFWSFIVSVMVLLLGAVMAVFEGVHSVRAPATITSSSISFGVLAIAGLFDGISLSVGLREYRRVVRGRPVGLWTFIRRSKDPSLYASLLEDSAALIGVGIAAAGLCGSAIFHIAAADGAASIAIGVLLGAMAMVLANETRSLIAGEAVASTVMQRIRRLVDADQRVVSVVEIGTLHLGPEAILVALTLSFKPDMTVHRLGETIRDLTAAMQQADGRIAYVYVRPPE
jgi:cation diffusion facilitator family transporter